jgi:hypothetical protein
VLGLGGETAHTLLGGVVRTAANKPHLQRVQPGHTTSVARSDSGRGALHPSSAEEGSFPEIIYFRDRGFGSLEAELEKSGKAAT